MITHLNLKDRLALLDNGQTVPVAFYKGETQMDDDHNGLVEPWLEADSMLVGPWFEWNGKVGKYDRKFAQVKMSDVELDGK